MRQNIFKKKYVFKTFVTLKIGVMMLKIQLWSQV